jgi:hypothetical protein
MERVSPASSILYLYGNDSGGVYLGYYAGSDEATHRGVHHHSAGKQTALCFLLTIKKEPFVFQF